MNIIVVDGLWGSGKAFVFKSIVKQTDCIAMPFQDGILDLFSKSKGRKLFTKNLPTDEILSNYHNVVSSSSFVFPSGKKNVETLTINKDLEVDYPNLFNQESFTFDEYLSAIYPDLNADYVCMGNGATYNLHKLSSPNVNFILIHVDRSAGTCLQNLLSRTAIEQSPATRKWEKRGYLWYFLRGYHSLALFKNFMLRNACDIHIKWGDLSTESIELLNHQITFTKPNDPENRADLWVYLASFVQLPLLVIRLLLNKH